MPGLSIFKELGAATTVVLGKVRLVDSGGTEITEATGHTIKVTLQASDGTDIGNVDVSSLPVTTTMAATEYSVQTSSGVALAANVDRTYALFVNDSDTNIYLRLGEAAVANEGIRLNANGGSYEINLQNLYRGAVYAIASSADKNLMVTEGV